MISLIWAQDQNGLIGQNGGLPWRLRNDMKYFQETTMQGDILMGRKTLESFPNGPLKGRKNLVLTRDDAYEAAGVTLYHSKEAAMDAIAQSDKTVYIIGGAEIYALFLPEADELRVTKIHTSFHGDTYFPAVDWSQWELTKSWPGVMDQDNQYPHTFEVYHRV